MTINIKHFKPRVVGYALLIFCTLTVLITIGIIMGLSASDWGTWIGAIGTVGALFGTIWIASTESRERHHREMVVARLTFAGLLPRIDNLQHQLAKIVVGLRKPLPQGESNDFAGAADMIDKAGMWTQQDLILLAAVPGDFGAVLAVTAAHINYVTGLFKSAKTNPKLQTVEAQAKFSEEMASRLDVAQCATLESAQTISRLLEIEYTATLLPVRR